MLKKNDVIVLKINDVTLDGSGVGRYDGLAVFVPMTAIGDTVEVKILKVRPNFAFAKVVNILEPSPDRIDNDCPVFGRCGGCVFRHISYEAELNIKKNTVLNNFSRIAGITPEFEGIFYGRYERYRNKAQYPVTAGKNGVSVGFYAPRSHRVAECEDCLLQPVDFKNAVSLLKKLMRENSVAPYDETTGKGTVRHLYLRCAENGDIMISLVINADSFPCGERFLSAYKELFGSKLGSFVLNINKKDTNVILGDRCVPLYGDGYLNDRLCGVKVRISPLSFYQVNHNMAEKLYEKAAEYAEPDGKNVLDLYCGAGTIGLSMADRAKSVTGVETIDSAVRDAEHNAAANGFDNCRFICGDAAAAAKQLEKEGSRPDVVILDPPRKGCDAELIDTVAAKFSPERVVYVSCDPATLARDCRRFSELGYDTVKAAAFDLFPRAGHVETVALMTRTDVAKG